MYHTNSQIHSSWSFKIQSVGFKTSRYSAKATTSGSIGLSAWDTVPTHTYIHITEPGQSMVYTAADPGSACPRAGSPKYPSSLLFFDFPPAKRLLSTRSSKNSRIYPIKNFFFLKGYESVNFRLRRARPEIRRPWTCSRSHTYMQHLDLQIHLLWSYYDSRYVRILAPRRRIRQ